MDENTELPKVEISGTPGAQNTAQETSPLSAYYRQPKIYITLPSKGEFYPEGALDQSEDGQYAVYSMTARDELMFKTPDALMNGASTVAVIQSCIPSIKDAWKMPSIDVDATLIAIRIATYGEKMDIDSNCPACKEELRHEYILTEFLDQMARFQYIKQFQVGDLTFHIRPFTYRETTKQTISRIEQEKIFNIVNDTTMSEEEKLDRFGLSFVKITEITVELIADTVHRIDTPTGSETNRDAIKAFVLNAEHGIFESINKKLQEMKQTLELKVRNAKCDKCEHTFDIGITMDQADFFAARS
jgi:predicted Zn-ribbon and HTH transcriptional regulator